MKEKQELKKQLMILSIVLVVVIIVAIAINTTNRENDSYTKIKDKTTSQNNVMEEPSVDDFMDRLKGLVEENNTEEKKNNTITYENTDIVQLESGEIVVYNENNQED